MSLYYVMVMLFIIAVKQPLRFDIYCVQFMQHIVVTVATFILLWRTIFIEAFKLLMRKKLFVTPILHALIAQPDFERDVLRFNQVLRDLGINDRKWSYLAGKWRAISTKYFHSTIDIIRPLTHVIRHKESVAAWIHSSLATAMSHTTFPLFCPVTAIKPIQTYLAILCYIAQCHTLTS